jgi:hypothetical protein
VTGNHSIVQVESVKRISSPHAMLKYSHANWRRSLERGSLPNAASDIRFSYRMRNEIAYQGEKNWRKLEKRSEAFTGV